MRTFSINRLTLTIIAAAALLADCSASQSPIGAPGAIPQRGSSAPNATRVHRGTSSWSLQVLYKFRHFRGKNPAAPLLDINGILYGTTQYGGKYNDGTVFAIDPNAHGTATVLHEFGGNPDGSQPLAGLTDVDGTLYGTTQVGGTSGAGTVFSITGGSEKVLYSFTGGADGGYPHAGLIAVKGTLYGTTANGGDLSCEGVYPGCGTVYSLSPSGSEHVLHSFAGGTKDGWIAYGGLRYLQGMFYGGTLFGGNTKCDGDGCGIIYRVSPSGQEKIVYRFVSGSDGAAPGASLINVNGTLYGTTWYGGSGGSGYGSGAGTVFSVTPSGTEKVLHAFTSGSASDGILPQSALLEMNGTLYGTTNSGGEDCHGGTCGPGTIFSVSLAGTENVLYVFSNPVGVEPDAALIAEKGVLYGTTRAGGRGCHQMYPVGCGTAFALSPTSP